MADCQKMYYLLCGATSRAIDAPPETARHILLEALHAAEEIYICTCEKSTQTAQTQASDCAAVGSGAV